MATIHGYDTEGQQEVLNSLVGKTLTVVEAGGRESGYAPGRPTSVKMVGDGFTLEFYHEQDCCEGFWLEDVTGDFEDLIGSPITMAVVSTQRPRQEEGLGVYPDSQTWTFYNFATRNGYVTLRFIGDSNGYYSETCDMKVEGL